MELISQLDTANQYIQYSIRVYKESKKQLLVKISIDKSDSIDSYFVVKDTLNFKSLYPAKECNYRPYFISQQHVRFVWSERDIPRGKISLSYRIKTEKNLQNKIIYGSVKYCVLRKPDEFKVLLKL